MESDRKKFILILKISCVLLFLGRGWQHFFWDAPFRTILWNEELLQGLVESVTSMSWKEYVTSPAVDGFIQGLTRAFGIFYFMIAIIIPFLSVNHKKWGKVLWAGAAALILLFLLMFMEKFFQLGMFIEHSLQMGAPIILYLALYNKDFFNKYHGFFKVLIALTFIGHGMYALGIHPVPGSYIDMIINVFGSSETTARKFLVSAGLLDILASLLLFFSKTELFGLAFALFWGSVTAMARVVAHLDYDLIGMSSHQWVMEAVYRFPHGLIPLALFLYLLDRKKKAGSKTGNSLSSI